MTGKELLLRKLKNYIDAGEVTKQEVARLFGDEFGDREGKEEIVKNPPVIHLNGKVEEDEGGARFVFLPFYVLLFIAVSAAVFLFQSWNDVSSTEKVVVTLGSGILGYVFGMFLIKLNSLAGILLHIAGGILLPFGALVVIDQFATGISTNTVFIALFGLLSVLYTLSYHFLRHSIIFFLASVSAAGLFYALVHFLLGVIFGSTTFLYPALLLGAAAIIFSEVMRNTKHSTLSVPFSVLGAVLILGAVFVSLSTSALVDALYALVLLFMTALALVLKRMAMLAVSASFLFVYLFYIFHRHLIGEENTALSLAAVLFIFVAIFTASYFLDKKFIGLYSA